MSMQPYDCIVVGAGVSGLSTAYALHRRGANLLLIESRNIVGGSIRSEQTSDGFSLENGPNTVVSNNTDMDEHFAELGITDDLLVANRQGARRYVLNNGNLQLIPLSPPAFLQSSLLSAPAKLRLMMEPLIPRAPTTDENIVTFFTRRLGTEPAQRLIDPFVSGVYAGDTTELSVSATFPTLWEAEQEHGSIVVGMIKNGVRKKRPEGRKRSQMITFRNGLTRWPQAMAQAIGAERVWLNTSATALQRVEREWHLTVMRAEQEHVLKASRVVLATPANVTAELVATLDGKAAQFLRGIPYPPLGIVHLAYRRGDVQHPLDGFGMLCPSREQRDVLGTLWPASLFPGRTPEDDIVLTTSFIGGARRPELAQQDEESLIETAIREQRELVGAHGEPVMARATRWTNTIPQYVAGHNEGVKLLTRLEAMWSGLHLVGNYRDGVSVEKCWHKGKELGEQLPLTS